MAEEEAKEILVRSYRDYRGQTPSRVIGQFLGSQANSSRALAILYFAWHPINGKGSGEIEADLMDWLNSHVGSVTLDETRKLAHAYANPRLNLLDYAYLLKRHPLELYCAGVLSEDPALSWKDLWANSEAARRSAASWLLNTRHSGAQDVRLRIHIEQDAFARMTPYWKRLGFPFEHLTPSYATAIGDSSDRPIALADLMGIIANDGVRLPVIRFEQIRLAPDTPYHTVLEPMHSEGERVMSASVAHALREVLADVVEKGTARRLSGAFVAQDGSPLVVGGKTGSGDNRFKAFARGGQMLSSRAVNRTATFVFFIGERYFGVMLACVPGADAEHYTFTSSLPVAILRILAPSFTSELNPRGARQSEAGRLNGAKL